MSETSERPTRPFPLGRIVATPGALDAMTRSGEDPLLFLARHAQGDWGEVCAEDARSNDRAVTEGTRIISAYRTSKGENLWVITEAATGPAPTDRSATTILLPSEY